MSFSAEIPVHIRSRGGRPKWVSGVGAATTCDEVLRSLLAAEEGPYSLASRDDEFVLVEQWRGVERPLAGGSRILPIWEAWGEERRHVRVVVKRVRKKQNRSSEGQVVSEPNPRLVRSPAEDETPRTIAATCRSAGAPAPAAAPSRSSRLRRRNSVSSNASDTLHPRKLFQQQQRQRQDGGGRQGLEDMMEEIMRQGRLIARELTRMDPRLVSSSTLAVFGPPEATGSGEANASPPPGERPHCLAERGISPKATAGVRPPPPATKLDYDHHHQRSSKKALSPFFGGAISGADLSSSSTSASPAPLLHPAAAAKGDNDGPPPSAFVVGNSGVGHAPTEARPTEDDHHHQRHANVEVGEGGGEDVLFLERTREMAAELARLARVNEELQSAETKRHILGSNLRQLRMVSPSPTRLRGETSSPLADQQRPPSEENEEQLRRARSALAVLRASNERAEGDIGANAGALEGLRRRCAERRDALKRLEYDVNVVEKEGRRLGKEYQKVLDIQIPEPLEASAEEGDDDIVDRSMVIYSELKELQMQNARLRGEGEMVAQEDIVQITPVVVQVKDVTESLEDKEAKRVLANGSPEGSSSGASSGADPEGNEAPGTKTVRFKEGEQVVPELGRRREDEDGDNSDTGLSSLHSDGGGDADPGSAAAAVASATARALTAAVEKGEPGAFTLDFGTLV